MANSNPQELYDPFALMHFRYDRCFLCGSEDNITKEHLFPQWLLQRYNLSDQKLTLLNGTSIKYRQLIIPCCYQCNNKHLKRIEDAVSMAAQDGYDAFAKLNKYDVWIWSSKIFYGILFKELNLYIDRKNPIAGSITNPEIMERFKVLHGFLQAARMRFEFQNFQPFSIFVVKTHDYKNARGFDYCNSPVGLTFAIRFGGIGIVGVLQDNGKQQQTQAKYYKGLEEFSFNPIQFRELYAQTTYASILMNRTPKYIIQMPVSNTDVVRIISLPLQGLSSRPAFDPWDQKTYAKILAGVLGQREGRKNPKN